MGGKKSQTTLLKNPHYNILTKPNVIGPTLVTIASLPIALLFALWIPGWSLAYIFSIISIGVLTSLDIRKSVPKTILASALTLLAISYTIGNTDLGGRLPIPNSVWSWIVMALPSSIAIALSAVLFSKKQQRFKIPLQNLLGTIAVGAGLAIGTSVGPNVNSIFSIVLAIIFFVGVGLAANSLQTGVLFLLEKFWEVRKFSMNMMPTMFFSYNAIVGYAYFVSPTPEREYIFLSSLGFLPVLCIVAVLVGKISVRYSPGRVSTPKPVSTGKPAPVPQPKIIVDGEHSWRQGQSGTLKITTQAAGQAKEIGPVIATIQYPTGKREQLRLSHASPGHYNTTFQPGKPGNYSIQIGVGNKHYQTVHESFLFTVQPAPQVSHPTFLPPIVQPRPAPAPVLRILPAPPPAMPKVSPKTGLPSLDSWDPRVWLNQEVHGYLVKEHIATGASGYVLRASFGQAGTEMALKIPILKTSSGSTALEETMSEATRLLELSGQSKYLVQIRGILVDRLNVQEIIKGDTGLYYHSPPAIVMEYMKGGTAKRLIEDTEYEALYYSEKWGGVVVLIGQMIALALDMIHRAGFVHLDVKPQNIMFNTKPPSTGQEMLDQMISGALVPKLGDLGSAVRAGGKVGQFTSEYAPAEQVLAQGADASMDVYALGASLYTMLARTSVHSSELTNAMNNASTNPGSSNELRSIWKSSTPDFAKIDPKFSGIIPVLKDMLSNDPNHRPEAGSVANSLQKLTKR